MDESEEEELPLNRRRAGTGRFCTDAEGRGWQASKTSIKDRCAYMCNNEMLSDIHFQVGSSEKQRIPAHKFILSVGSAVFDAMFNGPMASGEQDIEIPDVEPPAFLALLRFLYSDQVDINADTVMTTLYTAKKYAVPALESACVKYLRDNLTTDNAFSLLTQARLFEEASLAELCLEMIDINTEETVHGDSFTEIDFDTLCLVLKRDTLRVREIVLWQALVRWSRAECQRKLLPFTAESQKKVIREAIRLIRFPLMSIEDFANGPGQSELLADGEALNMFLYYTVTPKREVPFSQEPRGCLTKERRVCRFQACEARWGYGGTSDKITFMVDRRIFVIGFGLFGSISGAADYTVYMQMVHTVSGRIMVANQTSFRCDGSPSTFRVMFKEPVEIFPNTNYTACATLKGPDSHYGAKGLKRIAVECPGGFKVLFQFSYAAGSNNGTSIEDGQIPELYFFA